VGVYDVAAEFRQRPLARLRVVRSVAAGHVVPVLLAAITIALLSGVLRASWLPGQVQLAVGERADRDLVAPRSADYVSSVLTQAESHQLGQDVGTIYRYDAGIAQSSRRSAADLLTQLIAVRADATVSDKAGRLLQVSGGSLTPTTAADAAQLSDASFASVRDVVLRLLDQAATLQIRPEGLATVQQGLVATIPAQWSQEQSALAAQLIVNFVKPNSFPDVAQTTVAQQQAQSQVTPVRVHVDRGDLVLRKGDVATAQSIEELKALGLFREPPDVTKYVGTALLVAALLLPLYAYLLRVQPALWFHSKPLSLIGLLLLATAAGARILWHTDPTGIYLFPLAIVSMLIAVLLDLQLSVLITGILAVLIGYEMNGSLEMALLGLVDGLVGILAMWHIERLSGFFRAGVVVAMANATIGLAYLLVAGQPTSNQIMVLALESVANGAVCAMVTLGAFSLLGYLFGITTSLQLMELSRPNQPLLRRLLLGAPGTYHHSIIVSNLAERAADEIDADCLLARVGAYYHDIGKLLHPYYFIENQIEQPNIHQQLAPDVSAQVIAAHVTDGLKMAKQHHLPRRVCDIIAQHHGTRLIGFFYQLAKQQGGEIPPESRFRYPGPRPNTREAAIVMLADATEAAVRAASKRSSEDIAALLDRVFDERIREGELDDSDLTLHDLRIIKDTFMIVLGGIYHTRISYQQVAVVSDAV